MTLILTAFEPFGGESINASMEILDRVRPDAIVGRDLVKVVLPVSFDRAMSTLREQIAEHRPREVLAMGQASGARGLRFERVAVNLVDARIPDNDGAQPQDIPVVSSAPNAYFATLPVKAMVHAARKSGVPAEVSLSAGSYVCNALFYQLAYHAAAQRGLRIGFVHLPCLPQQAVDGMPSLEPQDMAWAVEAALRAAVAVTSDIQLAEGKLA